MTDSVPFSHPLLGQEEAISQLEQLRASGRLPHAWLITGPRGIGKASLAWRLAAAMLSESSVAQVQATHPSIRRMLAGAHADLLVIQPAFDAKKGERKSEISVEEARQAAAFLALTPGEGAWRVVIVDSADALNVNAANALLKTLEEPPPRALLLLVSHNPGRLLPTIRSRCRQLKLPLPGAATFREILQLHQPDLPEEEIRGLSALSSRSPGLALEYARQEALEMYGRIVALCGALPNVESKSLTALLDKLHVGAMHANWALFTQLLLAFLSRAALPHALLEEIVTGEGEALHHLHRVYGANSLAEIHSLAAKELAQAVHLYLDYRSTLIAFFHRIGQYPFAPQRISA